MTQATGRSIAPHVVVLGGGFGGLYVCKRLRNAPCRVTLIDQRNFHLFQPLLYQVATGSLSGADITSPFREIFRSQPNLTFLNARAAGFDLEHHRVRLEADNRVISYDKLVVAAGSQYHFFKHPEWSCAATALKTVEDAVSIRNQILSSLEKAELETDAVLRQNLMTFVVIGGGPTGVELVGAFAELCRQTMTGYFRRIRPAQSRIILVEADERILPTYVPQLSKKARRRLAQLGVIVREGTKVIGLKTGFVELQSPGGRQTIHAENVFWAAGLVPCELGETLGGVPGVSLHKSRRIVVTSEFTLAAYPDVYVIGDLAHYDQRGAQLPALAQVAIQEGKYVAKHIKAGLAAGRSPKFRYFDYGQMAVIGRNAAVAEIATLRFNGFPAWTIWALVHIWYLIGFDNKLTTLFNWAWNYLTRQRADLLITRPVPHGAKEDRPLAVGY